MKKKVAVFFGGRSVEHDISIITGHQLIENINERKFDAFPVYISRDGKWYVGENLLNLAFLRNFDPQDKTITSVYLLPVPGSRSLLEVGSKGGLFAKKQKEFSFDVAVLAMHGYGGEDGTLQGMLEMADIPYTSSGVLGSSAGMDKILMKETFRGEGIPVTAGCWFYRSEWEMDPDAVISSVEENLDYPVIVKPANLGSSIGINRANDRDELYEMVELAIQYDRRILVEYAVQNKVEYNCSVLGFDQDIQASVCEQPLVGEELLTFFEKYLRNLKSGKSSGMKSTSRIIPAPIDAELTGKIQTYSKKIFRLFDCKGVVRIDYLYDTDTQQLYVNEINTIPGSFAFYLWEQSGISFEQLIEHLIEYALQAHREKNRNVFAYDSEVLKKVVSGSKGTKQ